MQYDGFIKNFLLQLNAAFIEKKKRVGVMLKKQKILIDTDMGDDIDDAIALALGLKLDNIDVIGVTTVFKNVLDRAKIAKKILKLAGREDIPVYAGSSNTLNKTEEILPLCQMTEEVKNDDTLCAVNAETAVKTDGEEAVDFIIDCAEKYGDELIILGIGPYTNLAKAVIKNEKAIASVQKVVVMGGTYLEHHVEWNIKCDVEAADILFDKLRNLYCVGFDVTKKTEVSQAEYRAMTSATEGFKGYLATLTKLWSYCWHAPVLHDPLALYYISDPGVLQMKLANIAVEKRGEYTRGMTVNLDNFAEGRTGYVCEGHTHIAVAVDELKIRRVVYETLFK